MHIALTGEPYLSGRKRKSARRKPCGRIAPDKRPDDRLKVAAQPHRRGLVEALRLDERAESALGRALLWEDITREQYEAGMRFAVIVGEYRAIIEGPGAAGGSGRGFDCNAEACLDASYSPVRGHTEAFNFCGCRRRRDRYCRAYEALAAAGRAALREVVRVAVQGEEVSDVALLRSGLTPLAKHFGFS